MADNPSTDDRLAPAEWANTYRSLIDRDRERLDAADLEVLAVAGYLIGDEETCATAWEAAFERHLQGDRRVDAGRCAFWLALTALLRGQMAHAGGWFERAATTVDGLDCAVHGYLLSAAAVGAIRAGDADGASTAAAEASEIARRFGEADLAALAALAHGQARLASGDAEAGLVKLDDAMLWVERGAVGPIATGIVYCAVILECMGLLELGRASEWTAALDEWCRMQPELVPFRGQCLVHQAQLRRAAGDLDHALSTAEQAGERLNDPPHPALGLAHYEQAESLRVLGHAERAEAAYVRASSAGHDPMPGLALLLLARGESDAAAAGVRRALQETTQPSRRAVLHAAAVEIFRAVGDREGAMGCARELAEIADRSPSRVVEAMAAEASGSVLLDGGDAAAALGELRSATAVWRELHMPYELARAGVLVGMACAVLGDDRTSELELDQAAELFSSLGAEPDLARVRRLLGSDRSRSADSSLTERELEVLGRVAAGRSSPEIAAELSISRHTVRRHVENIFAKLGVNSRAAATAYAYEHDLL